MNEGFTNRMVENKKGLNRDVIKYIAIVAMLANHIATVFLVSGTLLCRILLGIGDFTAITMCYFLVEGYSYTHSKKKYMGRLLLFAILSQIPYDMAFTEQGVISFIGFNMLFTLLLCFLICLIAEKVPNIFLKIVLIILILICSIKCDWGIGAPVFTLLFIWSKNSVLKKKIAFIIPTALFGLYNFIGRYGKVPIETCILSTVICIIGMGMSGICIIYFYNGKRAKIGRSFSKWFFYIFYPLHLLIIALIRIFV
jgi:hypothetical protein